MRKFTGGILLCQFKHLRKVELTPGRGGSTVDRRPSTEEKVREFNTGSISAGSCSLQPNLTNLFVNLP